METLLSLAFDNLSSKDISKIRKGLRQIEGLLAQICLSQSSKPGHSRRASVVPTTSTNTQKSTMTLRDLPLDPAFREFFRLQESFEYNISTHLLTTLNHLLSHPPGSVDTPITSLLTLLHGLLILHPPSRHLFTTSSAMDSLLDLLDAQNPPSVQASAILVLVAALLNNPAAIRTFERVDGLLSIKDVLRSEDTTKAVKMRVMEFLYFYLMPECGGAESERRSRSSMCEEEEGGGVSLDESGGRSSMMSRQGGRGYDDEGERMDNAVKSTREKQRLLGQYLSNVDDLVQDLQESNLFG